MKPLMFVAVLMIAVLPAFADSITFSTVALQNNGFVTVPLGSGLDPLLNPTSPTFLTFVTSFGPIGAATFSSTLNLAGQQFTFGPFTNLCVPPTGCADVFGWAVPVSYHVINGTLTVKLNGQTEIYDFRYQSPVPEPMTLALIGTGSMAILCLKHSVDRNRSRQ
jgi:hypothetical protein